MGAMPEEIEGIAQLLREQREVSRGMRSYTEGRINGVRVVVVFSRWGKVEGVAGAAVEMVKLIINE